MGHGQACWLHIIPRERLSPLLVGRLLDCTRTVAMNPLRQSVWPLGDRWCHVAIKSSLWLEFTPLHLIRGPLDVNLSYHPFTIQSHRNKLYV